MRKRRTISAIKDHAKKRQQLEQAIDKLCNRTPNPENVYELRPDNGMQHAIERAAFARAQQELQRAQHRLERHMQEIRDHEAHVQNEREQSGEPQITDRTLTHHKWVYDPDELPDSNALAEYIQGESIAIIERSDDSHTLDGNTANAQLLLYNGEYGRWQDAGVHHYEDAIALAEDYAAEHEIEIDRGEINLDPGMDYDIEF